MSKKMIRTKEYVSPRKATMFLESRRENQRPLSPMHVERLAEAMVNDRWQYNGESLKFDAEGHLIDGQHRCAASVVSKKGFYTDIVFGLDPSVFWTIDQAAKNRTIGDVLKTLGEVNYNSLGAAAAWIIAYESGKISSKGKSWKYAPDSRQINIVIEKHPNLRESVRLGLRAKGIMAPGTMGFLHYIFRQKDAALADRFLEMLITGENLAKGNPVLHVRNILLEDRIYTKSKMPTGEKVALLIKAWNLLREGKNLSQGYSLRWRSGGARPEKYPEAL